MAEPVCSKTQTPRAKLVSPEPTRETTWPSQMIRNVVVLRDGLCDSMTGSSVKNQGAIVSDLSRFQDLSPGWVIKERDAC